MFVVVVFDVLHVQGSQAFGAVLRAPDALLLQGPLHYSIRVHCPPSSFDIDHIQIGNKVDGMEKDHHTKRT